MGFTSSPDNTHRTMGSPGPLPLGGAWALPSRQRFGMEDPAMPSRPLELAGPGALGLLSSRALRTRVELPCSIRTAIAALAARALGMSRGRMPPAACERSVSSGRCGGTVCIIWRARPACLGERVLDGRQALKFTQRLSNGFRCAKHSRHFLDNVSLFVDFLQDRVEVRGG